MASSLRDLVRPKATGEDHWLSPLFQPSSLYFPGGFDTEATPLPSPNSSRDDSHRGNRMLRSHENT